MTVIVRLSEFEKSEVKRNSLCAAHASTFKFRIGKKPEYFEIDFFDEKITSI